MQDSRWFRIVYTLLDTGKCTASELAEKLEVSVRTIYRDLDALSAAGIPVYATQGKGGGVSLLPEYVLDNVLCSTPSKQQFSRKFWLLFPILAAAAAIRNGRSSR